MDLLDNLPQKQSYGYSIKIGGTFIAQLMRDELNTWNTEDKTVRQTYQLVVKLIEKPYKLIPIDSITKHYSIVATLLAIRLPASNAACNSSAKCSLCQLL